MSKRGLAIAFRSCSTGLEASGVCGQGTKGEQGPARRDAASLALVTCPDTDLMQDLIVGRQSVDRDREYGPHGQMIQFIVTDLLIYKSGRLVKELKPGRDY